MKIAVSATDNSLDSSVDPRFGRCRYFIIVDTDTLEFEAIENESMSLGGGAGIQSAQFIAEKGARCVLTGNCGPNAYGTLSAAGVAVITGCSGSVREAVEQFKAGAQRTAAEPNVPDHFGSGPGFGNPAAPSSVAWAAAAVWAVAAVWAAVAAWAAAEAWAAACRFPPGEKRPREVNRPHGRVWESRDRHRSRLPAEPFFRRNTPAKEHSGSLTVPAPVRKVIAVP